MGLGRQGRGVRLWGDGEAVRQRHGPAGVVPLVHAVGGRGLVLPADRLVRAAGDRVWQGGGWRQRGGQRVRLGVEEEEEGGLWPLPCLLVVLGGGQGAGRLGQAEARGTAVLMVGGVAVRR